MPADTKVIDASALIALAFGEPEGAAVLEQVTGFDLAAPMLLPFEVANAAWKKAGRYPSDAGKILAALDMALAMEVRWINVDHGAVARLAIAERLTAYDASYLWAARLLGVPLVTLDRKLLTLFQKGTG